MLVSVKHMDWEHFTDINSRQSILGIQLFESYRSWTLQIAFVSRLFIKHN